jgi:ankyrin repeat protein
LLIRRGADVNLANNKKATALHFAAVRGQDQIVEMLIAQKARMDVVVYGPTGDGRWPALGGAYREAAPLHLAAKAGFSDIVERLLKAGAAIDITNSVGQTPLHVALGEGKTSTARLLLAGGANAGIPQSDGKTSFALAIESRDAEIVKEMIQAGADVNKPAIDSPREVQYPLHIAVRNGGAEILALLLAAKPQLEVTNKPDMQTPLWTALRTRQSRALEMLINAGADFNRPYTRRSPLQFAVKYGEPEAQILLDAGADPNQADENGNSLLHHAVFSPPAIVAALLKHGANPNVLNLVSETPLSQIEAGRPQPYGESGSGRNLSAEARRAEFQESASLLRSSGADEFLRRRFEIIASRAAVAQYSPQRQQVFSRATNVLNNYSLFELLASVYLDGGEKFKFPDFSNIRIRRLEGQKEVLVNVDVEEWLNSTNCAKDIPLQWGDDVEIPMKAHLLDANWDTLPMQQVGTLRRCLQRTVRVAVAGTNVTVQLSPWVRDQRYRFSTPPTFSFASLAVVIQRQPEIKNLLRTTTDLARVTVERIEENKRPGRMRFDITTVALPDVAAVNTTLTPWMHDLWLRDGDVIEIPEKQ